MTRAWRVLSGLMRGMREICSERQRASRFRASQLLASGKINNNMLITRRFSHYPKADLPVYPKANLPVLTQLEFFHQEDIDAVEWKAPLEFLRKHPPVLIARKHNKLIALGEDSRKAPGDQRPLMLSAVGRTFWHSLVHLVFVNKLRGHDISKALFEENLTVSPNAIVGLINPISDIYDGKRPFMGFRVLAILFVNLMSKIYGPALLMLSTDVEHFLDTLKDPFDDRLCVYHAALMSPTGKALLNIKFNSLVRLEVNPEGCPRLKPQIHSLMQRLPYLSNDPTVEETDKMHIIFRCLRRHVEKKKEQQKVSDKATEEKVQDEASHKASDKEAEKKQLVQSGYSVVGLHRNAVLHRVSDKDLKKHVAEEATAGKSISDSESKPLPWYCLWQAVQLLHFDMANFLPEAQLLAMKMGFWSSLEMGALCPRDEIFHHMTSRRIGPTPTLMTMFYYHSDAYDSIDHGKDAKNSTIYVGGLDPTVNKEELKHHFGQYGEVVYVRILSEKKCGFVKFSRRASAEVAIEMLDGQQLGGSPIRLSFARQNQGPLFGGHYAHPQTYDSYVWVMEVKAKGWKYWSNE